MVVEMDLEHLPLAVLIVLIGVVAGLGVWYLAIRLNQPRLKMIAAVILKTQLRTVIVAVVFISVPLRWTCCWNASSGSRSQCPIKSFSFDPYVDCIIAETF